MNTIQIAPSGADPAKDLQVVVTAPATSEVFRGSITDIQGRINGRTSEIASLQAANVVDQALLDSITDVYTSAGVVDTTAALTPELADALITKNNELKIAGLDAQIADATSEKNKIA